MSINISLTSALLENEDPSCEEESDRRNVEEELEAGDRTGGDVGDEDGTDDDKEAHYSSQPHQCNVRSAQVNSIVRETEDQKDDQDEDLEIHHCMFRYCNMSLFAHQLGQLEQTVDRTEYPKVKLHCGVRRLVTQERTQAGTGYGAGTGLPR